MAARLAPAAQPHQEQPMTSIPRMAGIALASVFAWVAAAAWFSPAKAQFSRDAAAADGQPVAGSPAVDARTAWERRDMGVAPPRGLHDGAFHGPTPREIPAGQVITTPGLVPLLPQREMRVHVFHVLGPGPALPGAIALP
jgi:hypothetical protein